MTSGYPATIDSFPDPLSTDTLDSVTTGLNHAAQHTNANDAVHAIETELGVNPRGGSATVVARLNANDTAVGLKAPFASPTFTGTAAAPTPSSGDNTTKIATTAFVVASTNTGVMNTQTGTTYTPVLTDAWATVTLNNAGAIAVTIPTNASVAYPIGTEIYFMWLTGAGQPTITAVTPATTTILSEGAASSIAPKIAAANAVVAVKKIAVDTWVVTGHIA